MQIVCASCLDHLPTMADNSIDAIVTDPPYEIHVAGEAWDNTGIAHDPALWSEAKRVLKPGGHLLAFSATRTVHRLAVAIEDAGFEIRDMVMWVYGQGIPKSLNVGLALDQAQGIERKAVETYEVRTFGGKGIVGSRSVDRDKKAYTRTVGEGEFEDWHTGLKPAVEPIVMARAPLSEPTVADNMLKWKTGAVNVGDCRLTPPAKGSHGRTDPVGRFPSNFMHEDSPEAMCGLPDKATSYFYCAKPCATERDTGCDGENPHNTPKPIELMRYLCRLVTPKGGVILDPFLGSGATAIAAHLEGFDCVGIELSQEYADVVRQRLKHFTLDALLNSA